jgi:hypothetical protein
MNLCSWQLKVRSWQQQACRIPKETTAVATSPSSSSIKTQTARQVDQSTVSSSSCTRRAQLLAAALLLGVAEAQPSSAALAQFPANSLKNKYVLVGYKT